MTFRAKTRIKETSEGSLVRRPLMVCIPSFEPTCHPARAGVVFHFRSFRRHQPAWRSRLANREDEHCEMLPSRPLCDRLCCKTPV